MQSLGKRILAQLGIVSKNDGERSFVFPFLRPFIRRIVRYLSDLLSGHRAIPNHAGSVATLAFFVGTFAVGISAGGHGKATMRALTSTAGFSLEEIKIAGNSETSDIDILQRLGLDETSSLVTLSLNDAHQALLTLPWVKNVELRKIYPATLYIKLSEREAFAIWQHGSDLSLINRDGQVIDAYDGVSARHLPLFVGLGADIGAYGMYQSMDQWPAYKDQIKAFIRVADRRWDIRLENGITLNLPEVGVNEALAHFHALDVEQNVLKRDIAEVDLRLKDRVTIRLTHDAMGRRSEALDTRAKMLKKEKQT